MVMLSLPNEADPSADAPPGSIESKRAAFLGEKLNTISFALPPSLMQMVDAVVEAAQACGDLDVLAERGRRHLRINIRGGDVEAGSQMIAGDGDGLIRDTDCR